MATEITYWGASCFELKTPTTRVLIDPYLEGTHHTPRDFDQVELIIVTHTSGHGNDHFGSTFEIASRSGAKVLCDPASHKYLLDLGLDASCVAPAYWGITYRIGSLEVRPLVSHHMSTAQTSTGHVPGIPLAFLIDTEPGVRIYNWGDTAIFDMTLYGELYRPTVALLGCSLPKGYGHLPDWVEMVTGELTGDEAARVAEMLGVEAAIACHYLGDPNDDPAAQEFLERVPFHDTSGRRVAIAPSPGQVIVVDGNGVHIG